MDAHIRKVYVPMTETGFYILLCLREEAHGYSIVQRVKDMTGGEILLSPGTLYGTLSKDGKGRAHPLYAGGGKTEALPITPLGQEVLGLEMKRIARLYRNMEEAQQQ